MTFSDNKYPRNRVLWSEGTMLRPQHFQQQDRFFLAEIHRRLRSVQPNFWGLASGSVDGEKLQEGKFALRNASGIMPDGTCFDFDDLYNTPQAITLPVAPSQSVFLCLREHRGHLVGGAAGMPSETAPYLSVEEDVGDETGEAEPAPMRLGALNLEYKVTDAGPANLAHAAPEDRVGIKIAHVDEVHGPTVRLSQHHIGPVTRIDASDTLAAGISMVLTQLRNRIMRLSQELAGMGGENNMLASRMMLMQTICEYRGRLEQLSSHSADARHMTMTAHPWEAYRECVGLASALGPITDFENRAPETFDTYDHNRLSEIFPKVFEAIRVALGTEFDRGYDELKPIEFNEQYAAHYYRFRDEHTVRRCDFYVAARAAGMPQDVFVQRFGRATNVLAPNVLDRLNEAGGRAVRLQAVERPAMLPMVELDGYSLFKIEKNSSQTALNWQQIEQINAIAIHVGVQFEQFDLRLFAVRV